MKPMLLFVFVLTAGLHAQPEVVTFSDAGAYRPDILDISPDQTPVYDYVVDDFDRDTIDEIGILRFHPDMKLGIAVYEQNNRSYTFDTLFKVMPAAYPEQLYAKPQIFTIDNHPLYRYTILYTAEQNTVIYLLNGRFEIIKTLKTERGYDRTHTGTWNGKAFFINLWDYNQDGRPDYWLVINSGADARPRSLLCLDINTNDVLMRKDFAPMPGEFEIVNFDNGSDYRIIGTLTGAGHGDFFGPFQRDESYLVVFSMDGSLLKSWEHAGANTKINYCLDDVNRDDYLDIIAVFWEKAQTMPENPNTIRLIDGASLSEIHTHNPGGSHTYTKILPLATLSSRPCFVTQDRAMHMEILSYNSTESKFNIERQVSGHTPNTGHFYSFDINRDGYDEIMIHSIAEKSLYVFDQQFNILATIEHRSTINRITICRGDSFDGASVYFLEDQWLKRADLPVQALFPPAALNLNPLGMDLQLTKTPFILFVIILAAVVLAVILLVARHHQVSSLVNSHHVAALILNATGKIVWINGAMLRLTGDRERIKGVSLLDVFKGSKYEPVLPHYQIFKKGEQSFYHQPLSIRDEYGKQDMIVEFSRLNGRIQLMMLQNSPSGRKQLEIWASLAQRLVHKAKTPLSSMLLSVQRMQREMQKENGGNKHYNTYLKDMGSEVERIRANINEFLRFSRLRPSTFKTCAVNDLLNDVCTEAKHSHFDRAHLQCELPKEKLDILVDRDQIREAFINFIDNAVQAGKSNDAHILISVTLQNQVFPDINKVCIEISDDGIGIARDKLESIFEPGYSSKENGSGMGLLIAKTLIEQNDGELVITSRESIGTTVTVLFPLLNSAKMGEKKD